MSENKATNEVAPSAGGQAADSATSDETSNGSPISASAVEQQTNTPTSTPVESISEFDPRTSYDSLVKQLETVNKSYGELRREFTRRTQYESELKKQIESLSHAFAQATEEEVSPEDFIKALQTQGIKALNPLKDKWTKDLQTSYETALQERDGQLLNLRTQFEIMRRQQDVTNYPDFAKLQETMQQLAESENCPVDWNQDPAVVLDTLYKLARAVSAETAVKQAKQLGRQEAEAQLAKEAATSVATGGKSGATSNPKEIKDIKKLREYFVSQIGEAE